MGLRQKLLPFRTKKRPNEKANDDADCDACGIASSRSKGYTWGESWFCGDCSEPTHEFPKPIVRVRATA